MKAIIVYKMISLLFTAFFQHHWVIYFWHTDYFNLQAIFETDFNAILRFMVGLYDLYIIVSCLRERSFVKSQPLNPMKNRISVFL